MTDIASITIPVGHLLDVAVRPHSTAGYGIDFPENDDVVEVMPGCGNFPIPAKKHEVDNLKGMPVGSSLPQRLRIVGKGKGTIIITESRVWEDKEAIPVPKIIVE